MCFCRTFFPRKCDFFGRWAGMKILYQKSETSFYVNFPVRSSSPPPSCTQQDWSDGVNKTDYKGHKVNQVGFGVVVRGGGNHRRSGYFTSNYVTIKYYFKISRDFNLKHSLNQILHL